MPHRDRRATWTASSRRTTCAASCPTTSTRTSPAGSARAFAEWSGGRRDRARPRLPALVARARRRARRGRHRARASASSTSASRRPTCCTSRRGSLDLPGVDVHREPQPEAVQRAEVLPVGRRPVGEETGLREIRALAETGLAAAGAAAARSSSATCSTPTSSTCCTFVDVDAMRPLTVGGRHRERDGRARRAGGVRAAARSTLHHLFPELDGTFPNHPADPIDPENQRDLKAAVLEHGADIGLAFDGDADRVFLVDERGAGRERLAASRRSWPRRCSRASRARRSSTT